MYHTNFRVIFFSLNCRKKSIRYRYIDIYIDIDIDRQIYIFIYIYILLLIDVACMIYVICISGACNKNNFPWDY